jgi:hypothetical protein
MNERLRGITSKMAGIVASVSPQKRVEVHVPPRGPLQEVSALDPS